MHPTVKFSIILNTRKRVDLLSNFLISVFQNTCYTEELEVLIRCDDDDTETIDYIEETSRIFKSSDFLNIKLIKGPRPTNLHVSLNELARMATGQNVFICNDDIQFLTPEWDIYASAVIENCIEENGYHDGIYYCKTECNSFDRDQSKGYCSFPIISKKAIDALGFAMYEDFVSLGGDSSIYRVYEGVGRVLDLPGLKIDHILHRDLQSICSPDLTAFEYRQKSAQHPVDPYTFDVSKEIAKLKEKINANY